MLVQDGCLLGVALTFIMLISVGFVLGYVLITLLKNNGEL